MAVSDSRLRWVLLRSFYIWISSHLSDHIKMCAMIDMFCHTSLINSFGFRGFCVVSYRHMALSQQLPIQ